MLDASRSSTRCANTSFVWGVGISISRGAKPAIVRGARIGFVLQYYFFGPRDEPEGEPRVSVLRLNLLSASDLDLPIAPDKRGGAGDVANRKLPRWSHRQIVMRS